MPDTSIKSRITKGSAKRKPMIADDLLFEEMFSIILPLLISVIFSFTMLAEVSLNIHSTKPNDNRFDCRLRSLQRSSKVCSIDSPNRCLNTCG